MMADDRDARIAQLEAELAALREREAALAAEVVALRDEYAVAVAGCDQARQQQTATADVLRVIASSPSGLRDVLQTIARDAARLCLASDALIGLVEEDQFRVVAGHGPRITDIGRSVPVSSDTLSGRVIQSGRMLHIQDLAALPENEFQGRQGNYLETGDRTVLCVPMMRDGLALGTIAVRRTEAEPFTDRQIALLWTVAYHAVIAIENARLFSELEERNTELQESNRQVTEALEQQTATAEILRVIASSPTNLT